MTFDRAVLDLGVDVSKTMALLTVLLHSLALAGVALSPVAWQYQGAFGLAIAASLAFSFSRYVLLRDGQSVIAISYRHPLWKLELRSGEVVPVTLAGQVVVVSYLLVMNFDDGRGRRFPVPLFVDAASREQHRKARVFFRMAGWQESSG